VGHGVCQANPLALLSLPISWLSGGLLEVLAFCDLGFSHGVQVAQVRQPTSLHSEVVSIAAATAAENKGDSLDADKSRGTQEQEGDLFQLRYYQA
jgi:hypothetical protein